MADKQSDNSLMILASARGVGQRRAWWPDRQGLGEYPIVASDGEFGSIGERMGHYARLGAAVAVPGGKLVAAGFGAVVVKEAWIRR